MSYIEPQLVFCHNDLNPNNIMYDPVTRQVSFLHLEFADMNFQAFELARHFYTLCGSDLDRVGSSDYVPAPEFQIRWCQHYLAAYQNTSTKEVHLRKGLKMKNWYFFFFSGQPDWSRETVHVSSKIRIGVPVARNDLVSYQSWRSKISKTSFWLWCFRIWHQEVSPI